MIHLPNEDQPCKDKKSNQPSGDQLYTMHACHTCHSLDGSQMIGPSFKDIYGKKVEFIEESSMVLSNPDQNK